jgi:hypothetical protein
MPPKRFRPDPFEEDDFRPKIKTGFEGIDKGRMDVHGNHSRHFGTSGQEMSDEVALGLATGVIPAVIGTSFAADQVQKKVKNIPVLGIAVRLAKDYADFVANPLNFGIVTSGPYATYLLANEIASKTGLLPRGPSLNLTPFIRHRRSEEEIGTG